MTCRLLFVFGFVSEIVERASRTDQGRRHLRLHHKGRDLRHVLPKAPLALEALTEARGVDGVAQTRDDTASNIKAAQRAERQREVARDRAEEAEEEVERLHTSHIGSR